MAVEEPPMCTRCINEEEGKPPRMMVMIGLGEKKSVPIYACSRCDGGAVKLAQRG